MPQMTDSARKSDHPRRVTRSSPWTACNLGCRAGEPGSRGPEEPQDRVGDRARCFPLREMADPIEHDALVARAEEALLSLRGGRIVARIAAAVDDQGRDPDVRVPREPRFQRRTGRVLLRKSPADAIGV